MAINPNEISTIRVGQLNSAPFNLSDKIPHEVGTVLKGDTIEDLCVFVSNYIGSTDSISFNPTAVSDGGTLPDTEDNEFILVGAGTYYNVSGAETLILTEGLNVLVSNSSFWSIGVEIPIKADLIGITQDIREGESETAPSEDAVFNALALKANISEIPESKPLLMIDYVITEDGVDGFFIPAGTTARQVFLNKEILFESTANNVDRTDTWTQTGISVILTTPTEANNYIQIFYQ